MVELVNLLVAKVIGVASADIEVDDLLQSLQVPVVHVRPAVGDIAQVGSLERSLVSFDLADFEAADICQRAIEFCPDPEIVEFVVRKQGVPFLFVDLVAHLAIALLWIGEDIKAADGFFTHGLLVVSEHVAVERGVADQHSALKAGDGLSNHFEDDGPVAPCFLEQLRVHRIFRKALDNTLVRKGHLDRVFYWSARLLFKARRAAVPELRCEVGGVHHRRRLSPAELTSNPLRELVRVGKPRLRIVATRARDRIVHRERLVVVQLAA